MQDVVSSPQGTAYGIFPPSWQVAAKTGTAQEGQGNTATVDWMIAFAPASHPEVALAVVVPKQALNATGAIVSGPIVRTMLSGIFNGAGSSRESLLLRVRLHRRNSEHHDNPPYRGADHART